MTNVITPTYRAGCYAPARGGRPKYPELWRGCVGAWAPCLGPTGNRLMDSSGYGNHATLTNMEIDTDWVNIDGRHALDFGGTDEYAEAALVEATPLHNSATCSLCFWARRTGSSDNVMVAYHKGITDNLHRIGLIWQSGLVYVQVNNGADVYPNAPLTGTGSHHLAMTFNGTQATNVTKFTLYIDGIQQTLTTGGALGPATTATFANLSKIWIGRDQLTRYAKGQIDDVRAYSRMLAPGEAKLLASRRGIAYEMARQARRSPVPVQFAAAEIRKSQAVQRAASY